MGLGTAALARFNNPFTVPTLRLLCTPKLRPVLHFRVVRAARSSRLGQRDQPNVDPRTTIDMPIWDQQVTWNTLEHNGLHSVVPSIVPRPARFLVLIVDRRSSMNEALA